jgi:hypothetical protein
MVAVPPDWEEEERLKLMGKKIEIHESTPPAVAQVQNATHASISDDLEHFAPPTQL